MGLLTLGKPAKLLPGRMNESLRKLAFLSFTSIKKFSLHLLHSNVSFVVFSKRINK